MSVGSDAATPVPRTSCTVIRGRVMPQGCREGVDLTTLAGVMRVGCTVPGLSPNSGARVASTPVHEQGLPLYTRAPMSPYGSTPAMFLGKFKYRVDEGDIDKPLRGKQFQEVFDDNPCRVPWLRERMIEKMEAGEMPSVHLRAFIAFCDYMEGKPLRGVRQDDCEARAHSFQWRFLPQTSMVDDLSRQVL
ncbi:hypothetical protein EMVG_00133 [Emiliania huxleyi virus PS401]|nr:hypothetical protein EMVG_00133 [Emiliania huxleyi virus PS401]